MAVACGRGFTLVVSEHGEVWGFGQNHEGQLGVAHYEDAPTPVVVGGRSVFGGPVVMVSAGRRHAACVTARGELFACGSSVFERPSPGDLETQWRALRLPVPGGLGPGPAVRMVACGDEHTLVLARSGEVWSGGDGTFGKLGHSARALGTCRKTLARVVMPGGPVAMVAAGQNHSVALAEDGTVRSWGHGGHGQLGSWARDDAEFCFCVPLPALVAQRARPWARRTPVMLAAGAQHTVLVTAEGRAWVWGSGHFGQLGLGARADAFLPVEIRRAAFGGSQVCAAACGDHHTLFVTTAGELWAAGYNGPYRTGRGGELLRIRADGCIDSAAPVRIGADCFPAAGVAAAAGGRCQCVAVDRHGAMYTWGTASFSSRELSASLDRVEHRARPGALGRLPLCDTLVLAPLRLFLPLNARVGHAHALDPLLALALGMGTHPRLGARGCAFCTLPAELLQKIVEACRGECPGAPGARLVVCNK